MMFCYVTDILSLGLIWHGYHDAVREGDWKRIVLYWKFLLPIFQQEGHYNYAREAFNIICQDQNATALTYFGVEQ